MYEDMSYENIKAGILEGVTLTDKREGSFVNDMVSPVSYELEKCYSKLDMQLGVMFIEDSSGEWLEKRGSEIGIFRKAGTKATGQATFTGNSGVEIPTGSLCATAGGLLYAVTAGGTIGEDGTVTLPVEADEIGDRYNVQMGSICVLPVSISGVTAVTNAAGLLGGTDVETDDALAERILLRKRKPGTSGNVYQYVEWAMEVNGVGDAKVFPLDSGPGTVTVIPITSGSRSPGENILEAVRTHIEEERPIGATVTVAAPAEVMIHAAAEIEIAASATAAEVQKSYEKLLESYIKNSMSRRLLTVDYYKCLSMFYDIEGVVSVKNFLLNNGEENISIGEKEIQVMGTVSIEEAAV